MYIVKFPFQIRKQERRAVKKTTVIFVYKTIESNSFWCEGSIISLCMEKVTRTKCFIEIKYLKNDKFILRRILIF